MSLCIQDTIINVSYPRSGHRLLREILKNYFGGELVFYESYTDNQPAQSEKRPWRKTPNYIKTHDFDLQGKKVLAKIFADDRRYLVQVRHPLEAIVSYYEFSLRHNHLEIDNEQAWRRFLNEKLRYWKNFVDTWLRDKSEDTHVVRYNELIDNRKEAVTSVVKFLTNDHEINPDKIDAAISQVGFYQYVNDKKSKKKEKRKLDEFKYYDQKLFTKIETELSKRYLVDIGIEPILC